MLLLAPQLVFEQLVVKRVFELPNEIIRKVAFPADGLVSVVADVGQKKSTEVGVIGCEGATGIPIMLGSDRSPHRVYVQVEGWGWVMQAAAFRLALARSKALTAVALRFTQTFMIQVAHTAVANANATLEPRLARWLLMASDRSAGKDLALTHEFLSVMLAVRRSGVTVALHGLESRGMLKARRGAITIIDRKALESMAGIYYGGAEREQKRLMR